MMNIKKIHHIAKVVDNIGEELKKYSDLGFQTQDQIFIDEPQGVRVGKVQSPGGITIELLEPLNENSPIYKFSKEKKGFHHVCIEVENIENYLEFVKEKNIGFQLTKITTSVFDGRRACFFSTNDREIIEIIEEK